MRTVGVGKLKKGGVSGAVKFCVGMFAYGLSSGVGVGPPGSEPVEPASEDTSKTPPSAARHNGLFRNTLYLFH
jgi:hypothetical protein